MNYYVFDTEAEANTAQSADFAEWKAARPTEPAQYWVVTVEWGTPAQRATDNKWVYPVCENSTATGRTIESLDTGGAWLI